MYIVYKSLLHLPLSREELALLDPAKDGTDAGGLGGFAFLFFKRFFRLLFVF